MSFARATRVLYRLRDIFAGKFDEAIPRITGFVVEDWQEAIEDMTDEDIRAALATCKNLSWPPTAEEFAKL